MARLFLRRRCRALAQPGRFDAWRSLNRGRGGFANVYAGRTDAVPAAPALYASSVLRFFERVVVAARYAATDKRIPRPLRWFAALGLLPVPGPFDEIVLVVVAVPLGLFYRQPLVEAWRRTPK